MEQGELSQETKQAEIIAISRMNLVSRIIPFSCLKINVNMKANVSRQVKRIYGRRTSLAKQNPAGILYLDMLKGLLTWRWMMKVNQQIRHVSSTVKQITGW
jgi:hypothetical protein